MQPLPSTPLAVRTVPLHATLTTGTVSTEFVLVQTTATSTPSGPRPRLTTVLVLDVSGSMKGEPLARVVASAQALADIMADGDALGVVAFDSESRTISPLRRLDPAARAAIKSEVAALRAGSNTNMSAGLSRGALLLPARERDERQLLLVLTDGQVNAGVSSKEGLAREVALIRGRGVAVSTLGYGASHNEDLLVAIANAGGGRYSFVSDPLLARSGFVRALGSQIDVVAENVRLVVQPDAGVEVVRVLGKPPTSFGAQGLTIELQDAIAGEKASVILELRVTTRPDAGTFHLAELVLSGTATGSGEPFVVGALATVVLGDATSEPDAETAALVAISLADDLREEARGAGDRRDFAAAIALLEQAVALLGKASGKAVADAVQAIEDDIAACRRAPSHSEYEVYKKAQRHYFDFASGSKAFTNQVALTQGTITMTERFRRMLPRARFVVVGGEAESAGKDFALGAESNLGRSPDAEVSLPGAGSISRLHARVVFEEGAFWLFDLGSTNATYVNGKRVERQRLAAGDIVQMGKVELRFEVD